MESMILFYTLLVIVAFLYASVGHGGASGYLALMALFGFLPEVMRPTALLLNILVAGLSFYHYYRENHFKWHLFWPFATASIPASFVGGMVEIDPLLYKKILGIFLLLAVARMLWQQRKGESHYSGVPLVHALIIGSLIGFFSGLLGIGGGIILSPVILLLHWANMKQTAAVSALFILVNSVAGLAGLFTGGLSWDERMPWMIGFAFIGGLVGSYYGAAKLHLQGLRYILAIVLLIASIKLLLT